MRTRRLFPLCAVLGAAAVVMGSAAACTSTEASPKNPGLAPRGTTLTSAKPTRQDLANRVSLAGKVTLDPVFGLVAQVGGQVRFLNVARPTATPTKPTRVATIWVGKKAHHVDIPAGTVLAGRLVDDRSTVVAGTPIVSAKRVGYGIVADIDGGQAYKISESPATVQAQIKGGPGPFPCTVLGTIAALPAGTVPEPPVSTQASTPAGANTAEGRTANGGANRSAGGSDPTGLRLVCIAPNDVKMINGVTVTVEVVTEKATKVLVLPVEAVAGSQGKGKVDVLLANGTKETRDVVLGLTDGKVIEIRSGLSGDDTVAIPGPNLPAAQVNGNGDPSEPGVVTK